MRHTYVTPCMQVMETETTGIIAASPTQQMEMSWSVGKEGQDASEDYEVLTKENRTDDFWQ